jgi:hypoxanthine phosphoribosyltransferase
MSFTAFTGSWSDSYIRKQGAQVIYTQSIDWKTFYAELDRVLREMAEEHFDAIAAIAQGGVIPAAILQQEWGIPLSIIRIAYRDNENKPRFDDAQLLEESPIAYAGKKVLLVDDVSRTGRTLARARQYLNGNSVRTFLVNGKADYRLFDTEECLRMPWKRD